MELSQLLVAHEATLTALYTSLSPSPLPLIASHLGSLRTSLDALLAAQLTTATAELQAAEERLAAGWRRVHDWQMALGEQPSAEKKKGDGPVLSLAREVEELRDSMKGRMEERGKRVLQLHQRLRELRDTTGRAFVEVAVEEDASKGWEELDLRLEKMGEMEREVVRCEAEITRRRQLLDLDTSEIFTLRTELGISLDSPSSAFSSEAMAKEAFKDPLDEEILWHLGVGEARQPRREMHPTLENVERVRAKRNWLEAEKAARNATIQQTYDKLYPLWTMLGVSEDEMEEFVNKWMGSTMDVVNAYTSELARMLLLKRSNLASFMQRERLLLTALWDTLYLSHPQRLAQFPAYSISVEPTRVWNAKLGCEEEEVSENVCEELLVAHERERERVEGEVEEARPLLARLGRYFEIVDKWRELEAAAADPSRLLDKSRGAAGRLAQEAKDRKRVERERPKLEAELRAMIPQWEAQNHRPFLVNGVSFIEGLDEQIRAEEEEKENRKRAKQGLSATSSYSSVGSSSSTHSSRPLKAHHTGGSSLSSSTITTSAHHVAPLKRQMTGASSRSTASSTSSHLPPPHKRAAVTSSAPSSEVRPRSRSVLGHRDASNPSHSAARGLPQPTPQTLKAQHTGASASSSSFGGGAGGIAQTPAQGMRLPSGWGQGAAQAGQGATPIQTPSARTLLPQATGGFRPRAG